MRHQASIRTMQHVLRLSVGGATLALCSSISMTQPAVRVLRGGGQQRSAAAQVAQMRGGGADTAPPAPPGAETAPAAPPRVYKFPDGSIYSGGVLDGMQHGQGEWRSADGDAYVGEFARGVFEGRGQYTDGKGNVYEGGFLGGVFHGKGTYKYADGRAECTAYEAGREQGEGVRWSQDRARAWRLDNGAVAEELSLQAAADIAAGLGLAVPAGVYAPSAGAEARLRERIRALDAGEEEEASRLAFEGHVDVPAREEVSVRPGTLVAHSQKPLVDAATCDKVIEECELRATSLGGWTTSRHASYPTTDVPVQELPQTLRWLTESLLPDVAWPFIAHAFDFALNDKGAERDGRAAVRVSEAFIVKYNASSGQRLLKPHRDGAVFSFNVALNDLDEYEGGGTYFRKLDEGGHDGGAADGGADADDDGGAGEAADASALRSPKGHIMAHSSALLHGGHPISSGVRYILVAFCTIDPAHLSWASRFYGYVQDVVDPGDEQDDDVPGGSVAAGGP